MPLDAICVKALVKELNDKIAGGRVDKIYQPEKDEITLLIYQSNENHKLVLSANASHPRIHLTKQNKENPISAPLFCMLLRKHISGGRVVEVKQHGFERVVDIVIESINELGDYVFRHLICEIMGRHSNIILTDGDFKILDSIKHIDITISSQRNILPGLTYTAPPSQGKINPLGLSRDEIYDILNKAPKNTAADKAIANLFLGISTFASREILYRAFGNIDIHMEEVDDKSIGKLADEVYDFFGKAEREEFYPCVLYQKQDRRIVDFAAYCVTYRDDLSVVPQNYISCALDEYFVVRDQAERLKTKAQSLNKYVSNLLSRHEKKLAMQLEELKEARKKDTYKIYGDLIIANLYRISEKQKELVCENFYDNNKEIVIPLDESLSPSKNAQVYYKKYNKAKNAEIYVTEQIEGNLRDIEYLKSVLFEIESAQDIKDLEDIKEELVSSGFMERQKAVKKEKKQTPKLREFIFQGYQILVGKNNVENDYLTMRLARSNDLWCHAKNIPGCHTVVKYKGEEFPNEVIEAACKIAAYYSKSKGAPNTPVDYTRIKNVKKPKGAKAGMVIYEHYKTAYVSCDEEFIRGLSQ